MRTNKRVEEIRLQMDLESAIAAAERDADGTTQAKFLRNLESRIYAQISKQLVDKMFGTEEVDLSLIHI